MAATKTGTPTVIKLVRKICRVVAVWGAHDLGPKTTTQFATAVAALIVACHAFEALDDQPAQVDNTGPAGPEDIMP